MHEKNDEFVAEVSRALFNEVVDPETVLAGVRQLVESERWLHKALQRLLNARVAGTVTEQSKAQQKGAQALEESFAAQHEAGAALRARPCLDPNKMHGAADEFGGSDYD